MAGGKRKSMVVLLGCLMMIGFASTSFGGIIWATNYESSSLILVSNPANALGAPNGNYATIGSITLVFSTNFLDLTGPDVIVVDANHDLTPFINLGDVYSMTARHLGTNTWSTLTFDTSTGGWRSLEIGGSYSGLFDAVNLTYWSGGSVSNLGLEVDAVGVNVPEPGTLLLLGSGLLGLAIAGSRKKFRK